MLLERLASLRSTGYGNGGHFIIPRDFPPRPSKNRFDAALVYYAQNLQEYHEAYSEGVPVGEISHKAGICRRPQLLLGRKLVQIDNGGREGIHQGHKDIEYAVKGLGKDGVDTGQEHVFREMDANVSECFINQAEDSDEDCIYDTNLLIDLDNEATVDTAFLNLAFFQSIGTDIWSTDLRNMK